MTAALSEWLERLQALQPDRIELGLQNVRMVLEQFKLDLSGSKIITVAGTNGKGSVVTYLEALYRLLGISTLAYTSPHILHYNERIRINSKSASDADLVQAFAQIEQARMDAGDVPLTYFEFGTLAAIALLAKHRPAIAIMEVGLGGRLDAVNVLDADVAVITSIGIDHVEWLGPDRESIGHEKAGIMRSGNPVICGDPEPPDCIAELAEKTGAVLYQYGEHYQLDSSGGKILFNDIKQSTTSIDGLGELARHQRINAATALVAIQAMQQSRVIDIDSHCAEKLMLSDQQAAVVATGKWLISAPARMQKIASQPDVWLDVAHNPHAAKALAASLKHQPVVGRTYAVLAMLSDKDVAGVVAALDSIVDHWYLAPTTGSRGLNVKQLQQFVAKSTQSPATALQSVPQALEQARSDAQQDDRIVVVGSFTNATTLLNHIT